MSITNNKIIKTLEAGKLPLTKWMSNNEEVLTHIEENKKLSAYIDEIKAVKTLGLMFYPGEDMFGYKIKELEKIKFTKRGLLSVAASLYDPIGWMIPVIVKLRLLIQSLWVNELGWDDNIDPITKQAFEKCLHNIKLLNEIKIPRWLHTTDNNIMELVGFCDASKVAYAAVIYSRILTKDGWAVTIIASKGRVTPLKTKKIIDLKLCTIPKLELEAILLLAELYSQIIPCFNKSTKLISYTDSEVALAWVRSKKELQNKWIKNRVQKIKIIIKPTDLHYVKSAENPADPASRGLTP